MSQLRSMVRMRKADRMAEERRWAEAYTLYREAAVNFSDRLLSAACWQDAAVAAGQLARYSDEAECGRFSLSLLHGMKRNTPLVRRTRIRALLALAEALYRTGDLTGGEQVVRQVFGLVARNDSDFTADCFHRLGQCQLLQGEIGGALTAFARAAETARTSGTGLELAQELLSLGITANTVGDGPTARDCAAEAERLARASTHADRVRLLASSLRLQGLVLRRERRLQEAVSKGREALSLMSGAARPHDPGLAQIREGLAISLVFCGEPTQMSEAVELLTRTHTEAAERGDAIVMTSAAVNLANAHAVMDAMDEALAWAERAVRTARGGQGPSFVAVALLTLGTVLHVRGEHADAEGHLLEAVTLWERVRATTRSEREHIDLLGEQAQVYRALQRCRVARHDTDGALEAAERVRGLLLEQRLLVTQSSGADTTAPAPALPVARTAQQLSELATRHTTVALVYSLLGPARPSVTSGATTAYIWVISPSGTRRHHVVDLSDTDSAIPGAVSAHGAPADETFTDAPDARGIPVGQVADGGERAPAAEPPESRLLRALSQGAAVPAVTERDSRPLADPDRSYITDADLRLLADALLRPVEEDLQAAGMRRLVVVPDGSLHYVPFNALPLKDNTPLVDRYTVALAPSVRLQPTGRQVTVPVTVAPSEALVVGNPDPPAEPLLPGLSTPVLPALPAAEREARAIAELYDAPALLGARATRQAVLDRLPYARFAHFATHALPGEDTLRIPGALCLSPSAPADPAGAADSGVGGPYLRADDIQPLDLSGCHLVVLSACRTGWGRLSPEGNLGLARTFLAGGVDCVVVSLWPVDDTATARLMTAFHQHLAAGATTGEALRHAVRETRRRHTRPVDWAGFTLLGSPDVRLAREPRS
ncbi:CHAT domain-containing protein [Streptomyces sp. NPDC005279]|uniref:CHAT domain-containing protein n=1 Tax=Streptomyces sp. NPDC005279 TaxID=3364712 RepID=UPI0036BB12E0